MIEWADERGFRTTHDEPRTNHRMASANVVDGKNLLKPAKMRELGFAYEGIGQGKVRR